MQFSVSFDTSSPDLGSLTASEKQAVLDVMNAAATIWSHYLTAANVTLDISIVIDNSLFSGNRLAVGGPHGFFDTGGTSGGQEVYQAGSILELLSGQDPNGSSPDLNIGLTPNSIRNLLYFSTTGGLVPSDRDDALSVFLHEIGHGLGIYSTVGSGLPGTTLYDTLVQGGKFVGTHAEDAYRQLFGSLTGVPLDSTLSHISDSSNLGNDLMSTSLPTGTIVGVSGVDLGILQDIGVPIRLPTAGNDVIYAVPGIDLRLGDGQDIAFAAAGGSTIYGEAGNDLLFGSGSGDNFNGGDGDDVFWGFGGNDALDGGTGADLAVFTSLRSNFQITRLSATSVQIKDLRSGAPDGTDILVNVEKAQWSDNSITNLLANSPPVVTTANISVTRNHVVALSSLFSVSDPDGDTIVQYQLWDSSHEANSGYWIVNGVAQPASTIINVSAAQLANTYFLAGSTPANLQIRAYDGAAWSAPDNASWAPFTLTPVAPSPVVTTANISEPALQSVALSSLFTVSDPEGRAITRYQLWDSTADSNSGHWVVNGVAQASNRVIDITAAQLAQTFFSTGTISDQLQIRAYNGESWSAAENAAWSPFNLSVTLDKPIVTGSNTTAPTNTMVALSSLFSVSDPDGRPISLYRIFDASSNRNGPSSGILVVNGVAQPPFTAMQLTPAQMAQTYLLTGTEWNSDIRISAFNGLTWSAVDPTVGASATVSLSGTLNNRTELTLGTRILPNSGFLNPLGQYSAQRNQTLTTDKFAFTYDADGDPVAGYQLIDNTSDPNSGHWVVNGVAQDAGVVIDLTPARWAQTTFVTGTLSDDVQMRVSDGKNWSATANAANQWVPSDITWGNLKINVANNAPVVTTANIVAKHDKALALSSLFSVSDADGDTITKYQIKENNTPPGSGHFAINGVAQASGEPIEITAAQLSQTSFVTGTVGDLLFIRAFDGISWSAADNAAWSPFTVSIQADTAPVVNTGPIAAAHNQTLSLSSLFAISDADGDTMTRYQLWDGNRDPSSGHFAINGVAQGAGVAIDVSAAQLAQTSFVTGTVGDSLEIRAFDGVLWSAPENGAWSPFAVSVPANRAPVVATGPVTGARGQTLALSALFSVSDADGDTITRYQLWDGNRDPNSGHFVVNGVAQSAGTVIDISAAQAAQTSFVVGSIADGLEIRAFDGNAWSAPDNAGWSPFVVSPPVNHAPVVTTGSVAAQRNQTLALSDLFTVGDADSDAMTRYQLWDSNADPRSGHFVINGVTQSASTIIDVSSAQLAQTSFVTGTIVDSLEIRAFDGQAWSAADNAGWSPFTVSVPANRAPVVTTGPVSAQHYQTIALTDLFSVSDADGDTMTRYQLWDSNRDSSSGHFIVNGVIQSAGTVIDVSAAQLAQTSFVTGTVGDSLEIRAFDGQAWSAAENAGWSPFNVSVPAYTAPVVTTHDITSTPHQILALSSLFTVTDPDGDTMTRYQLWDSTSDHDSGYFAINGVAQSASTVIDINATQLAQTTFVTGSVGDSLQVRAFDGRSWSAGETAAWSPFHITT